MKPAVSSSLLLTICSARHQLSIILCFLGFMISSNFLVQHADVATDAGGSGTEALDGVVDGRDEEVDGKNMFFFFCSLC